MINTQEVSHKLRERSIDVPGRRLLLTRFDDSEQSRDLSEPINSDGVGRVRRFFRGGLGWPENPLPLDPAFRALGLPRGDSIRAQVFQNAGCNWRCWYCFVPFSHLSANEKHGRWVTPEEIVDAYLALPDRPPMIDLTGGQPDLVPEWVPWMMQALRSRGVEKEVFLWSDDNLSGDYFWTKLDEEQRDLVRSYPMYARVACFKGFDETSFQFNTMAAPEEFGRQFERFRRYVEFGLDVFAYATFTSPDGSQVREKMERFVGSLQEIHPLLPLRTVPLEIKVYTPVERRLDEASVRSMQIQREAIAAWEEILSERFTEDQRRLNVCDVDLHS